MTGLTSVRLPRLLGGVLRFGGRGRDGRDFVGGQLPRSLQPLTNEPQHHLRHGSLFPIRNALHRFHDIGREAGGYRDSVLCDSCHVSRVHPFGTFVHSLRTEQNGLAPVSWRCEVLGSGYLV